MTRALIIAAGMLGLAAAAGSAQTVGVSAVIVEPVEALPVEYEVRLGPVGYEVKAKRVERARTLLLERTIVREATPGAADAGSAGSGPASSAKPLKEAVVERREADRLLVTRVIAANA